MNAMKIAAPALLLGLALTASPALAQQSSEGHRFGRPADRPPVNTRNCSLSRSCSPGPYVSVIPYASAGRKKSGTLHLAIRPSHADVYVDGVYAGRADDFDGSARHGSFLELPPVEESDPPAIWRKERIGGALRLRQTRRRLFIQHAKTEATRIADARDVGDAGAIR